MKAETPINLSSSSDVNSIVARVRACYLMACFLMVAASFGNELAGDSPSEVNDLVTGFNTYTKLQEQATTNSVRI